ncbi:hypothetical protein [Flavobacterium crassostreae]|uniref:Uncharacterized protein n=1 Tax=Flavobacterium crassostreae TaxID=1763534 RepID=A0A1B9E7L9_9FLAO|nr:hypothetical protein [Flavobacterium crassostreae]OCB77950.1 hypothetical protein LPBF_03110 [Flavobacterium crassostreae]
MTYQTLETIPYKIVLKIVHDPVLNLHLLTDEENPDLEKLELIWASIFEELIVLNTSSTSDEILKIECEISALNCKHDLIQLAIVALEFDYDEELANILRTYGYKITAENYYSDLEMVRRESQAILTSVKKYQSKLPKQDENQSLNKINIDEVLAFYCTILGGLDFDYNTVTYTKVMALQKQVSEKIKAIEKSNPKK